jgi:hypothetical protein
MARSTGRTSALAFILGGFLVAGASTARADWCSTGSCTTVVNSKKNISGNGSDPTGADHIKTVNRSLTWTFQKPSRQATRIEVGNFQTLDCPGTFSIQGNNLSTCGFILTWEPNDTSPRTVAFSATAGPGLYKFSIYEKDDANDHDPHQIDPDLEIDTGGFAPLLLIRNWLAPIAAIVFLIFGYWFGFSRGARTARP